MRISRLAVPFSPVQILLETPEEVAVFRKLFDRDLTVALVLENKADAARELRTVATDPRVPLSAEVQRTAAVLRGLAGVA